MVNYANNLSVRGDWAAGRELLQVLVDLRPDSTILLRSVAAYELQHGNLMEGWILASRAWQLQPNDPENISALAQTWLLLGEVDEAERIIRQGLEKSGQNRNILSTYWMTLLVQHRLEEAETLVRDLMSEYGESLPDALHREFSFRLGMIAFFRDDPDFVLF